MTQFKKKKKKNISLVYLRILWIQFHRNLVIFFSFLFLRVSETPLIKVLHHERVLRLSSCIAPRGDQTIHSPCVSTSQHGKNLSWRTRLSAWILWLIPMGKHFLWVGASSKSHFSALCQQNWEEESRLILLAAPIPGEYSFFFTHTNRGLTVLSFFFNPSPFF